MAEEKNEKNGHIGMAIAGVALTAVGAAAGAILANRELRDNLGKKTTEALKVVSKLALQAEKGAEAGLKKLKSRTIKVAGKKKPNPKKIKVK